MVKLKYKGCLLSYPIFVGFRPICASFAIPAQSVFRVFLVGAVVCSGPAILFIEGLGGQAVYQAMGFVFEELCRGGQLFNGLGKTW